MEIGDDERRENLLRYAPRRPSHAHDDGSIRPILQRLSRGDGESAHHASRIVAASRADDAARKSFYGPLLVGCALSAGVSAGLALLAIGWFGAGAADVKQSSAVDLNPKSVQTISFKQEKPASEASPAVSDTTAVQAEPATIERPLSAVTPTLEPVVNSGAGAEQKLLPWAAKSIELSSQGWQEWPRATTAEAKPSDTAGTREPPAAAAPPPVGHPAARHASRHAHPRHHTHHVRRHGPRARAQAAQQVPPIGAPQATPSAPQSAWQSLFGHPVPSPARGTSDGAG
jgi:hypothetical protein